MSKKKTTKRKVAKKKVAKKTTTRKKVVKKILEILGDKKSDGKKPPGPKRSKS